MDTTPLEEEELERQNTVWEPVSFMVGDTVRVKLGECPHSAQDVHLRLEGDILVGKLEGGHPNVMNNELGVAISIDRTQPQGHYYTVAFVDIVAYKGKIYPGAEFAAIELEPATFTMTRTREQRVKEFCTLFGFDFPSAEKD